MFLDQKLADSPSNSVIKEYIGFSYASSNHISVATSGIRLKSGFYQWNLNNLYKKNLIFLKYI